VDQAARADQRALRHRRERREDPDLERAVRSCLVATVNKRLALIVSVDKLQGIPGVTLFEKTPIAAALFDAGPDVDTVDTFNPLEIFDLQPEADSGRGRRRDVTTGPDLQSSGFSVAETA
jgi:hypothetical protein